MMPLRSKGNALGRFLTGLVYATSLLLGCSSVTDDEQACADFADVVCRSLRTCSVGEFDARWGDDGACRDGETRLFGLTIGAEGCLHESKWPCVNSGGIAYGLLGAIIDYAHKGRRTIYRSPSAAPRKAVRVVPDIGPERKGVAVALAF
jgi:hypothetical protein